MLDNYLRLLASSKLLEWAAALLSDCEFNANSLIIDHHYITISNIFTGFAGSFLLIICILLPQQTRFIAFGPKLIAHHCRGIACSDD